MDHHRTKAVVAVFGGADPEAVRLAKTLGEMIARSGQILLTGGSGPGDATVKESATAGAGNSPWVGVERTAAIGFAVRGPGFVINSDLGHRRNYLEACLCDAAIALWGGDGTISEAVFSLALRRPVALVGDRWHDHGSLDRFDRPEVLQSMVERAFRRVGLPPSNRPDLDKLLNIPAINAGLEQLPQYRYFRTSAVGEAVGWIVNVLASGPKAGSFPQLAGYEDVAAAYQKWLRAACETFP